MNSLFSIFDPSVGLQFIYLNWVRAALLIIWIPRSFYLLKTGFFRFLNNFIIILNKEIKLNFSPWHTPGLTHWVVSIFVFLALNNILGLLPYTFTASSHLRFSLTLALFSWLGYIIYSFSLDLNHNLAHFVPLGTPYILIPFMVLIEIVRRVIRPLTLSVRLAANIVAGHLLLVLISRPAPLSSLSIFLIIRVGIFLIILLERAVAFIQAYVFRILSSLYISEVNFSNLNYFKIY
jgi:F-type H+-transporting ATPase subunit a